MRTEEIYEHLERISNLLRTDNRRAILGRGLQPVQLEALHYLGCCNRYSNTPASVADYLGLTKGTVSQTLGLLEAGGLIEKRPDAKDRRVVHLVLTETGRQVVAEAIPPQVLKNALALISAAEQEALVACLNRFLRGMQQGNRLRTFGECQTCRHHVREADESRRCGLTGETLTPSDSEAICREHEPPVAVAGP
jgi:DNA-binding MarR family transcriptional regulator